MFQTLENKFIDAATKNPPDYKEMRALLDAGVDINAFDKDSEETILSEVIHSAGWENYLTGEHLRAVVPFILDNGYDVRKHEGLCGGLALVALCYSTYDENILDVGKLLMRAGADPKCVLGDSDTALSYIGLKESAAIAVDEDYNLENLFYTLYEIVDAPESGLDPEKFYFYKNATGRTIKYAQCELNSGERGIYDTNVEGQGLLHNCFDCGFLLILDNDDVLEITSRANILINNNKPNEGAVLVEHEFLNRIIGKRIEDICCRFEHCAVSRTVFGHCELDIVFDDETVLRFTDNTEAVTAELAKIESNTPIANDYKEADARSKAITEEVYARKERRLLFVEKGE